MSGSLQRPGLSLSFAALYSTGHVMNDLCASCWFTYLLLFLQLRGLVGVASASVLLCGQAFDAVATCAVGALSDRSRGGRVCTVALGKRQFVYFVGVVAVVINFALIFVVRFSADSQLLLAVYYCVCASLFNVGWAAVQVTHMAMVPDLSHDEHERVVLNSARYAESVAANIVIFVALGVLTAVSAARSDADMVNQFSYLAVGALGVGILATFIFLVGIQEPDAVNAVNMQLPSPDETFSSSLLASEEQECAPAATCNIEQMHQHAGLHVELQSKDGWKRWLHMKDFWLVVLQYTFTRLSVNVSQTFFVFYLLDTLQMSQLSITTVPCIVYIASFAACMLMKYANQHYGRKPIFLLGTSCCLSALTSMLFLTPHLSVSVYFVSALLGLGNGTLMVCSSQLPADLMGNQTQHGAFIYGSLSFGDKMLNGIAIFLLQSGNVYSGIEDGQRQGDGEYIRFCTTILPLLSVLIAAIIILVLDLKQMNERCSVYSSREESFSDAESNVIEHK